MVEQVAALCPYRPGHVGLAYSEAACGVDIKQETSGISPRILTARGETWGGDGLRGSRASHLGALGKPNSLNALRVLPFAGPLDLEARGAGSSCLPLA